MRQYTSVPSLSRPVDEHDHVLGPEPASVTLIVYGDYECEHTRPTHHAIKRIMQRMGDRLRLVFRHFPLVAIHKHAQAAAEASEAAAAQGRFWEMHDRLFADENLEMDAILEHAEEIGLDTDRFERELKEHTYAQRVHEDVESGIQSGVGSTPTIFINEMLYSGPLDFDTLAASIEAAARDAEEEEA